MPSFSAFSEVCSSISAVARRFLLLGRFPSLVGGVSIGLFGNMDNLASAAAFFAAILEE
jgi:hypothetical protein